MPSIGQMLEQINGLRGTRDVTDWEDQFIASCMALYVGRFHNSNRLSGKQVEIIERIWKKHFAG